MKDLFKKDNGFCHISIKDFKGGLTERYEIEDLKNGDKLIGVIDYPLDPKKMQKVEFTWKENRFDLCRQICEAYHAIYEDDKKDPDKYGIWGHDIGDLVIEQIRVDAKNKKIELSIGS